MKKILAKIFGSKTKDKAQSNNSNDSVALDAQVHAQAGMAELKPFVQSLPHGEALWEYILTGKGEAQLKADNAFVDLDCVIVALHAKEHAPDFYATILSASRDEVIITQDRIETILWKALKELKHSLLENDTDEHSNASSHELINNKQQCCLRILDIFFNLFDQNTLSDKIHQQLVVDSETACLSNEEFYARYSLEVYGSTSVLPDRLKQKINEFFDSIDGRMDDFDLSFIAEMEPVFAETRLAYDPKDWPEKIEANLAMAGYLLNRDAQLNINDEYTQSLSSFVEQHLYSAIKQALQPQFAQDSDTHKSLLTWLADESNNDNPPEQLINAVTRDLYTDNQNMSGEHFSSFGEHQRKYRLFDRMDEFMSLLICCYYLSASTENHVAKRLLKLCFSIAPQTVLISLTILHVEDGYDKEFSDEQELADFLSKMQDLGAPESAIAAFNIEYNLKNNHAVYEQLVNQYIQSKDIQETWSTGLGRIHDNLQQNFLLDVYRANRRQPYALAHERDTVLTEQLRSSVLWGNAALAAYFSNEDILYEGYTSDIPPRWKRPIKLDPELIQVEPDARLTVALQGEDDFSLLASSVETPSTDSDGVVLDSIGNSIIIFKQHVVKKDIFAAIEQCASYEDNKDLIAPLCLEFLADKISFAEYQNQAKLMVNFETFDWTKVLNFKRRNTLLPIVLAEGDVSKRNKLIRLFCIDDNFKDSQHFQKIAFELFLESLLIKDEIGLEDRRSVELDDLLDEVVEEFEQFEDTLHQQISSII